MQATNWNMNCSRYPQCKTRVSSGGFLLILQFLIIGLSSFVTVLTCLTYWWWKILHADQTAKWTMVEPRVRIEMSYNRLKSQWKWLSFCCGSLSLCCLASSSVCPDAFKLDGNLSLLGFLHMLCLVPSLEVSFGILGRMLNSIVPVPDHCLQF